MFGEKLIIHTQEQIMHLGVANTMANIRSEWWIPRLRSKVKKVINQCDTCKVFSTKPYSMEFHSRQNSMLYFKSYFLHFILHSTFQHPTSQFLTCYFSDSTVCDI